VGKTLYQFSGPKKEIIKDSGGSPIVLKANLDPLESELQGKDIYLIPENSTDIAPSSISVNETLVFDNGSWKKVDDYRGKVYYKKVSKEKIVISELGIKPDSTLTELAPSSPYGEWSGTAWVESLELLKDAKRLEINSAIQDASILYDRMKAVIAGTTTFSKIQIDFEKAIVLAKNKSDLDKITY